MYYTISSSNPRHLHHPNLHRRTPQAFNNCPRVVKPLSSSDAPSFHNKPLDSFTDGKKPSPVPKSPSSFFSALTNTYNKFCDLIDPPLPSSVDPNHVLAGNYAPVHEISPSDCTVVNGELPPSLNGVYIRNGPNPQHWPLGPLHFYEGDGMLHSLKLSQGRATFCSRYVKTYKYILEEEAGFPIFPNVFSGFYGVTDFARCVAAFGRVLTGHINPMRGFGLANTSLAFISNKLLALGESDLPYVIKITAEADIETLGRWDFDSKFFANMTAHPKFDADTEETFCFRCSPTFPYLTYFYFDKNGSKHKDVDILSINRPTFIHDFAVTRRFVIFPQTQLVVEPKILVMGKGMPLVSDPEKVPTIGVLSRYAINDQEMKWFRVPGFNAMHVINAWEEGDEEIVLVAPNVKPIENIFQKIDTLCFSLEKIKINLKTGEISKKILSPRNLELGSINTSYIGKKSRFCYVGIGDQVPKMSGLVKIDVETECEVSKRFYGPNCYGGEPLFVAKEEGYHDRSCCDEDDGYVVTYVHNESSGESKFLVMDAKSPALEIVATVKLPRRVPYGFHGMFLSHQNCLNL